MFGFGGFLGAGGMLVVLLCEEWMSILGIRMWKAKVVGSIRVV